MMKGLALKIISTLMPPVSLWRANRVIDADKEISRYREQITDVINGYEGDLGAFVDIARDAHRFELDRGTHFDSKAGNYLGNVGVVLSILSLGPILAAVLGVKGQEVFSTGLAESAVLFLFGYASLSLLLSAYYSSKALKVRRYSYYFTSEGLKEQIQQDVEDTEQLVDLLVAKKANEKNNLQKSNVTSVSESLSRNGLISLGFGIVMMIVIGYPI